MTGWSASDNVIAHDAGIVRCIARINNKDFVSDPFTLRISGEQLVYCVIP